ncbi:hydrolase [Cystobacter fuscus]|uniref:Hydrolase n=1 Tax=Cystobacter fuscus TaxID=43 RepID=A0A250J134_9BACT|nr:amidohydrolase family protein [Cystobacter fuscus]ATB37218.1 hydrolase [Cystobacter fuscus]
MEHLSFIALEEHYTYAPVSRSNPILETFKQTGHPAAERLGDLGAGRLVQMDRVGIRYQLLSLLDPGVQELDNSKSDAARLAREANDALVRAIQAHPDRLGGFAALATQDPETAALELRRALKELGHHRGVRRPNPGLAIPGRERDREY